jgi:hypothetical protein
MFRLIKLASYALLGYTVYELIVGVAEGREQAAQSQRDRVRRPLRSNEPGRGVISS